MRISSLAGVVFLCFLVNATGLLGLPVVTEVSPLSGNVSGGNVVTIKGSGFTPATHVSFGVQNATSFLVIDDTTIQATAPTRAPGAIEISVTTPSGTSAPNPPGDYYTYQGNWFAYIPDFGSANVFPINVTTQVLGVPIPVGAGPNDVVVNPSGTIAIVVNSEGDSVTLIDVATQTPTGTVSVGESFPILAVTPDGKRAAIVNYSSNSVTLFDLTTFMTTVIPVGSAPTSIAIIPNGSFAYVTNSGSSNLTQINLQTLATVTIPTGAGSIPSFIAITPDGNTAIFTDDATNSAVTFNPNTLAMGVRIFGFFLQGANLFPGIAVTPDGTTAWVTNSSSNTISSVVGLNTVTPTFGTSITVQTGPNGIAITPDGALAYVCNANSNSVSIVTFAGPSVDNRAVGIEPTDPGITPDQAPVAYFTVAGNQAGQVTTFDASASLSPVGTIVSYAWNFGDGTPAVTLGTPVTTHTYATGGVYNVTLTVTNSAGTSTQQIFTGQVTLNNGQPSAMLSQMVTVDPPLTEGFTGHRCKNKFATQTEYVNKLFWQPNRDPSIVLYWIYRNGIYIAAVPATGPLKFIDDDRPKNSVDSYSLIAVDSSGLQSSPITISVP
jgi:DNA-binding beta-propeller fold protein YncE